MEKEAYWAQSLQSALQQSESTVSIQTEEALAQLTFPFHQKLLEHSFSWLEEEASQALTSLENSSWSHWSLKSLDLSPLDTIVRTEKPDLVVGFHPIALLPWMLHRSSTTQPLHDLPALALVVPQYAVSQAWILDAIDGYLLSDQVLVEPLQGAGIPSHRLHSTGLPLHQDFSEPLEQQRVRHALRLDPTQPVVLLHVASLAPEHILSLMLQLSLVQHPVQWLLDYGVRTDIAEKMRKTAEDVEVEIRMFGQQKHNQAFLSAADLILGPAQASTLAPAYSTHVPYCIWPAQNELEQEHIRILQQYSSTYSIPSFGQLSLFLDNFFTSVENRTCTPSSQTPTQAPDSTSRCVDALKAIYHQHQQSNPLRSTRQPQTDAAISTEKPLISKSNEEKHAQKHQIELLLREKKLQQKLEELDEHMGTWEDKLWEFEEQEDTENIEIVEKKIESIKQQRTHTQQQWRVLQDEKQTFKERSSRAVDLVQKSVPVVSSQPLQGVAPPQARKKQHSHDVDKQIDEEWKRLKEKMRRQKASTQSHLNGDKEGQ